MTFLSSNPTDAIDGFFNSPLWSIASVLLPLFFLLLWVALIYWTYQDAKRRFREPAFIAGSVALAVLIPYLGAIIYMIIRPPEYLIEARERELELLLLEQRLAPDDAEGREMVGRLLEREGGGDLSGEGFDRALSGAGVARQDDVAALEARLAELEFRGRAVAGEGVGDLADDAPTEAGDGAGWRDRIKRGLEGSS